VHTIVGNILNVMVYVYSHKSYHFVNTHLDSHCIEQDFEVCAIKLSNSPINLCVLSLYRSPSGNVDAFILKLEEILNILFQNQLNLVICGDFNVSFMTNNTRKYKIISLLKVYNLCKI
jgi:endonuclease/exonuclease/phosphatase family metal-dependent hydrolase